MSVSPSGHSNPAHQAEGKGVEPSSPVGRTAFSSAARQPYPATFHISVDRPGIEPESPVRRTGVFPLDHQPEAAKTPAPNRFTRSDPGWNRYQHFPELSPRRLALWSHGIAFLVSDRSGSRTHSILRSKRGWSAGCLPSRSSPGRSSNHRFLGDQASWPLDHGAVFFRSHGARRAEPSLLDHDPESGNLFNTSMTGSRSLHWSLVMVIFLAAEA